MFDPAKDAANLARHGVSLRFGERVFADAEYIVIPTFRPQDGEDRYKAVGLIDDKLWTVVHVMRDDIVRLVSVRRSNDGEERAYRD